MPKFIIEREVPGAGSQTSDELREGARASNAVRMELGPDQLQWVTSYVTDDKVYCVFIAEDEEVLREHARCLDVPASRITRVVATTDPSTAE